MAGCRELALLLRHGLLDQELDLQALDQTASQLISLSSSLKDTLNSASSESKRFRAHYFQYEQLCSELQDLVMSMTDVGGIAILYQHMLSATDVSDSSELKRMFDALDEACTATTQQMSLPRNGTHQSSGAQTDATSLSTNTAPLEGMGRPAVRLLDERIHFFRDVAAARTINRGAS